MLITCHRRESWGEALVGIATCLVELGHHRLLVSSCLPAVVQDAFGLLRAAGTTSRQVLGITDAYTVQRNRETEFWQRLMRQRGGQP